MTARGASATILTEMAKAQNAPFHLVEIRLDTADGGTVYMCDASRAVVFGGNTYLAMGHFLSYTGVAESAESKISTASLALSGIDQTMVSMVLSKQYLDRQLVIYKGFLNTSTDVLLVDPITIFNGRMDEPAIQEDPTGSCTVAISATDAFSDFTRLIGRHTNPNDQATAGFASDRGLDLVAALAGQTTTLIWGRAGP